MTNGPRRTIESTGRVRTTTMAATTKAMMVRSTGRSLKPPAVRVATERRPTAIPPGLLLDT